MGSFALSAASAKTAQGRLVAGNWVASSVALCPAARAAATPSSGSAGRKVAGIPSRFEFWVSMWRILPPAPRATTAECAQQPRAAAQTRLPVRGYSETAPHNRTALSARAARRSAGSGRPGSPGQPGQLRQPCPKREGHKPSYCQFRHRFSARRRSWQTYARRPGE